MKIAGQADVCYENVSPATAKDIVDKHIRGASIPALDKNALPGNWPFFVKQKKVVLSASSEVDPEKIESYLAKGGYTALAHALREMTPESIIEEMTKSGLRGRGGAGFPTGLKWDMVRKAPGERKYVVANGDEGDPGAYMDRTLMESDPHRVLEGMAIAGYAVGADQGYIYVRGEYPLAAEASARRRSGRPNARELLGKPHPGQQFQLPHRHPDRAPAHFGVRRGNGPHAVRSWDAADNQYRDPPYPAQNRGLWGGPTLINNVETFGNITDHHQTRAPSTMPVLRHREEQRERRSSPLPAR